MTCNILDEGVNKPLGNSPSTSHVDRYYYEEELTKIQTQINVFAMKFDL